MQLSGLLEKLKGLFTPSLLISSVMPLLCFILLNGAIAGQYSETVDAWLKSYLLLDATPKTIVAALASVGLLVLAYVFSTFNLALRETIEGRHLPGWLKAQLKLGETRRLDQLENRFNRTRRIRRQLPDLIDHWVDELKKAREKGVTKGACQYPDTEENQTRTLLGPQQKKRWRGEALDPGELEKLFENLKTVLEANCADPNISTNKEDSQRLGPRSCELY